MTEAFLLDCMEGMRRYPDKYFDLAVVDPPYGGGSQTVKVERERLQGGATEFNAKRSRFGGRFDAYLQDGWYMGKSVSKGTTGAADIRHWDVAPPPEYFEELARVSKNQIIWGGNYFDLPPTRCFLVWRKTNIPLEGFSMAPVEYAWTSFSENAGMYECFSSGQSGRFHPTQKPIELYKWIFSRFTKPGDKILDTHLGSGSSRIAAYDMNLDFVGFEINEYYYKKQEDCFADHTAQLSLFVNYKGE